MDRAEHAHALRPVRTTCPYCGVGCGVLATPDGKGGAAIKGDPEHPANFGRLCSKGSALGETLGLETRLLHPIVDGAQTNWAHALDQVAKRLQAVQAAHGPGAIAFYLSGQLLTEDYYVANKLAKGFIGTPHVDTNSRLCMASSVAGPPPRLRRRRRAAVLRGSGDRRPRGARRLQRRLVPPGALPAHPDRAGRARHARRQHRPAAHRHLRRQRSASAPAARHGRHSVERPAGLACRAPQDRRGVHRSAHARLRLGAAAGRASWRLRLDAVARATGLEREDIATFYGWFAGTPRVVSCYSQGVNQSAQGTDKVNAIINCHLATGRIGKPGCGPLSLTGQPNAMGGREVGGLANMLAAHMGFSDADRDRVRRFWDAPNLVAGEGLKAVQMFDAIADGRIKALWVMGTNPAVSLPRADAVRDALTKLELFVVSENVAGNDTVRHAHIRLPAAAWGEKDGTVTNSERRISRQRAFLPLPASARPDWWMLCEVARRMGYGDAFAFRSAAEIFAEHARLSGFENDGTRAFDISAARRPARAERSTTSSRFNGRVASAGTGRAPVRRRRFLHQRSQGALRRHRPAAARRPPSPDWPFVLNTGRVRDQWHTMTRTGLSPRLSTHIAEPYVEIHPDDAGAPGAGAGHAGQGDDQARLGRIARAGQSRPAAEADCSCRSTGRRKTAAPGASARWCSRATDPFSGQPEAKATPACIAPLPSVATSASCSRASRSAALALPTGRTRVPRSATCSTSRSMCRAEGWPAWLRASLPEGERTEPARPR